MRLSGSKNYIIHTALYTVACTLITNSIIQGFLLENGMNEKNVLLYLSTVQAVQVGVMFLFSLVVDKLKKIMQLYAFTVLFQITMLISLIIFCLFPDLPQSAKTALVFTAGILTNADQAMLNILTFKAPYYYLDMDKIGNTMGYSGALCGLSGAIFSGVLIFFTARFDYNSTMLVFFTIGAALIIAAFFTILTIRSTPPTVVQSGEKSKKVNLFGYKPFYMLILPNLLRGFNSGIFVTTMTIGFTLGITDKSSSAVLTLILQGASILSNFAFSKLSAPRVNVRIAFLAGLALVVTMPAMMSGNIALFYCMYFLTGICISLIDAAIPVVVIELVDYEFMGQYSSYRMLLHTLGITVSGLVAIPLLELFGGMGLMVFSASCQIFAGTAYYLLARSVYKSKGF